MEELSRLLQGDVERVLDVESLEATLPGPSPNKECNSEIQKPASSKVVYIKLQDRENFSIDPKQKVSSDDEKRTDKQSPPTQLAQLLQSGSSVESSPHRNMSERDRNWVFYCLAKSRGLEATTDDDLSPDVIKQAQELMSTKMVRVPTRQSIITIWKTFVNSGTVSKKQRGGRPRKTQKEEEETTDME